MNIHCKWDLKNSKSIFCMTASLMMMHHHTKLGHKRLGALYCVDKICTKAVIPPPPPPPTPPGLIQTPNFLITGPVPSVHHLPKHATDCCLTYPATGPQQESSCPVSAQSSSGWRPWRVHLPLRPFADHCTWCCPPHLSHSQDRQWVSRRALVTVRTDSE